MNGRAYIKIPAAWIDDYRIASMPDSEFRAMIEAAAKNPARIIHEGTPSYREEWTKIRKRRLSELLKRDKYACRNCGDTTKLEIDHIIPLARGGTNDLANLQFLCKRCNGRKWAHYE